MPRIIKRKRKRPLIEVDPDTVLVLLREGARIVVFQKFLGGENQLYMTLLAYPNRHFISYSSRPMPFIIQNNGKIIEDGLLPKPPSHYHPS